MGGERSFSLLNLRVYPKSKIKQIKKLNKSKNQKIKKSKNQKIKKSKKSKKIKKIKKNQKKSKKFFDTFFLGKVLSFLLKKKILGEHFF